MQDTIADLLTPIISQLADILSVLLLAVVSYLVHRLNELRRELIQNTQLTEEVAEHTNGVLAELRSEVQRLTAENAMLKQRLQSLQLLNDEHRKIIAYVRAHPAGQELLKAYEAQRRVALHDEYLAELERRLFGPSSAEERGEG